MVGLRQSHYRLDMSTSPDVLRSMLLSLTDFVAKKQPVQQSNIFPDCRVIRFTEAVSTSSFQTVKRCIARSRIDLLKFRPV